MKYLLGLVLGVAVVLAPAVAQVGKEAPKEKKPPSGSDYRELFKKPTNAYEFYNAMLFEIEVGRYDLAAGHVRGLLDLKSPDAELVKLADEMGIAAFLKLRNILNWYDDPKANAKARKDVDELIDRVTSAVKRVRTDPRRIEMFVGNLLASPEEHDYAIKELYRSGAAAVPTLIEAIRNAPLADRPTLVDALGRMGPATLPPLIAALDSNDPRLKADVIDICRRRMARDVVPELWFLSASPEEAPEVRKQAADALSYFLDTSISKLPPAKVALTQEAERYYRHQVRLPDPEKVTIWRWDGKRPIEGWPGAPVVSPSRAEEYYGLKYAGQALRLDPTYVPAQVVWLSLSLDKAQAGVGLAAPLDRAAPAAHAMLGSVSADLVNSVLNRALKEDRVPVILAAIRNLGARDEVKAGRPATGGTPPLLRALHYADRRVQFAAAEAVLRVPGSASWQATARVVDVLRRALAADPGPPAGARPKVIVGYFDEDQRARVAAAVAAAGYEPLPASTGREVMRRLGQSADVDLILMEAALPDPGLPHLLGQLRADANAALLPVILTAPPDREGPLTRHLARQANVTVVPSGVLRESALLAQLLQRHVANPGHPALAPAEMKDYAERSIVMLSHLAKNEPPGYDVRPAGATVLNALRTPTRLRPEGQRAAAEIASRLPGAEPQAVLADVVLDAKRPLVVRVEAAAQLVRHVQAHGALLVRNHVRSLAAANADPATDPLLKAQLALVMGSLQPDARLTGERLLQYQPPTPGAPPPPPKKE